MSIHAILTREVVGRNGHWCMLLRIRGECDKTAGSETAVIGDLYGQG